jgi:hypothetical protein
MANAKGIPEEATEEPKIVSPEEDAKRALERVELVEGMSASQASHLADADSPLRMPGELSSKSREATAETVRAARAKKRALEAQDDED